jgi:hypothetical protein
LQGFDDAGLAGTRGPVQNNDRSVPSLTHTSTPARFPAWQPDGPG